MTKHSGLKIKINQLKFKSNIEKKKLFFLV
jgi:hypothetical protein